jgi:hypothetical protein
MPLPRVLTLALLAAVMCIANSASAQEGGVTFPTPTIWQKLGFYNAAQRFQMRRDARVNRNGFNPQREAKPKLLKIADKANLESPNPLIKAAAKIKEAEDLAPQKIKALRYLSTKGCSCNADVETAILSGLEDCEPSVRTEAIKLVASSVEPSCGRKKGIQPERKFKICKHCQGNGCQACNFRGSSGDCCEEVSSCGSCGSGCGTCCTKKVQDMLNKIANGQDSNGCYFEPNEEIRSRAASVLAMCPAPPVLPDDPDPTMPPVQPCPVPQNGVLGMHNSIRIGDMPMEMENADQSLPSSADSAVQVSLTDMGSKVQMPDNREQMIRGTITHVLSQQKLQVSFEQHYELPAGAFLYITSDSGEAQVLQVEQTEAGRVNVRTAGEMATPFLNGDNVWIGVLGSYN